MMGPDPYDIYEPTTYPWGPVVYFISFLCNFIAFASPYWLSNDGAENKNYFLNTGKCLSEIKLFFY